MNITRRRVESRVWRSELTPWMGPELRLEAPPEGWAFPFAKLAFAVAALLCLAWWATAAEVLVASARREGGRVLSCQYLVGNRVVERQFLDPAHGSGRHACPVVRFG